MKMFYLISFLVVAYVVGVKYPAPFNWAASKLGG